jgi:diadenosine tetraphosphate (Ap4A) HIT family hydrolase
MLFRNEMAFVAKDRFPVSKGHLLIIPFRHVERYFDVTPEEKLALLDLLDQAKQYLDVELRPDGYNIGVNVGEAAGQTIMHVHIHLIPRYRGDVANPRGGVRGIIPGRQSWR